MAYYYSLLLPRKRRLSSNRFALTWRTCVAQLAMTAALVCSGPAVAAPGEPDNTFATICPLAVCSGGRLFSTVGSEGYASISAMAVQPDGAIVVAGSCDHRITGFLQDGLVHQRICVQRYRTPLVATDSWIDPTFGTSGTTIIAPFRNNNVTVTSLALNGDGNMLVAGTCTRTSLPDVMCVVRLLGNGQLDGSFGSANAAAYVEFPAAARTTKMLLQTNGQIVMIGQCGTAAPYSLCATRLHVNGAMDTSYGSAGVAINTAFDFYPTGAVLRSDGSVSVVGTSLTNAAARHTFFSSFLSNGALGNSNSSPFPPGVTTLPDSASGGVALTAAGNHIIAGTCRNNAVDATRDIFCLRRLNAFGYVDGTFGSNGNAYANVATGTGAGTATPHAIVLGPDGKILVVGTCKHAAYDYCVARFDNDGTLDAMFNSSGFRGDLTAQPTANGYALALQGDGKILVGGGCTDAGTGKFCTVRLNGGPDNFQHCNLDIDDDGKVLGTTDAVIHARVAAGLSGAAALNALTFAPNAKRKTWPAIRDFLGNHCGMSVQP